MKYILKDNQNQFFFLMRKEYILSCSIKKKLKKIDRINLLHVSNYDTLTKRNQILIYLFFYWKGTHHEWPNTKQLYWKKKKNPQEMMLQ
jgi:hypothetical protein